MIQNEIQLSVEERKLLKVFTGKSFIPQHITWNDLMPVVEKIEYKGYSVIIQQRTCYIQSHDTMSIHSTAQFFDTKIETVWAAVIGFINWYNSLTSKNEVK